MTIHVRPEQPGDEDVITRVNDAAFGQSAESTIVKAIRRSGSPNISLVAVRDGGIVGHILFTTVGIESTHPVGDVMALGPMAVLPAVQRHGIGARLVREGLHACTRAGSRAVVVVGHPDYYPRFGFRPASTYGLRCEYPVPDEVFMALELRPRGLADCSGLVRYRSEFGSA